MVLASTSLRRKSLTSAGSRREKDALVSLGNLDTRIPAPCPRLRSTCPTQTVETVRDRVFFSSGISGGRLTTISTQERRSRGGGRTCLP